MAEKLSPDAQLFLQFCSQNAQGVSDKAFREEHPEISAQSLVTAINELVAKGRIELLRGNGNLIYRKISAEQVSILEMLDGDEKIVYQCIKAADDKGIWTRDLKTRTNLHQTVITKTLRLLESRKLIKAVKSVKNPTRKLYMLAHLQPSTELTGGPWFSENELDTEFISEMCRVCHRYIVSRSMPSKSDHILPADYAGYPTLAQIARFVRQSGITTAELTMADVAMLLERLVYDGLIERVLSLAPRPSRIVSDEEEEEEEEEDYDGDEEEEKEKGFPHNYSKGKTLKGGGRIYVYKAVRSNPNIDLSFMGSIPCGTCPVYQQCSSTGPITPAKCEYFTEWLAF